MANYATPSIRTVALVGHGGAGKTTLAEALLARAGAIRRRAASSGARTVCDFDPLEKQLPAFAARVDPAPRHARRAHPPHRHARLARLHRPGDRRARRRRDRGGRRQRADRHRDDHVADDAVGGEAQPLPPDHRQQDRRRERRPAEACSRRSRQAFGKECLPINLPADGGKHVVDCFFNPVRRRRLLVGRRCAPGARRPGRRGRRGADGEVPRAGRGSSPSSCTRRSRRRCAKATSSRSASCPRAPARASTELLDVLVKLAPNPTEGNPPLFTKGEGDDGDRVPLASPTRRSTCSRTCSRSSSTRSSASSASSACTRARSPRTRSSTSATASKPFKVGHLFLLQGKKHVEVDRAVPGDIGAVAKVDEIDFDAVLHDSHDEDHIHLRAARVPDADARPRDRAEAPRRRAADLRRAAQDDAPRTRRSSSSTTRRSTRR